MYSVWKANKALSTLLSPFYKQQNKQNVLEELNIIRSDSQKGPFENIQLLRLSHKTIFCDHEWFTQQESQRLDWIIKHYIP